MSSSRVTHEQILLDALRDGQWHDGPSLYRLGLMLHSRTSSLKDKGYGIEREQRGRTHFYRLVSRPLSGEGNNSRASTLSPSPLSAPEPRLSEPLAFRSVPSDVDLGRPGAQLSLDEAAA